MEENAQPTGKDSVLTPDWRWRLVLAIVVYGVFLTVALWDGTGPQWLRILVAACCLATAGFVTGYRPHSELRQARAMYYRTSVFGHLAAINVPTSHLVGILKLPAEHRYAAVLTPAYIVPYAMFVAAYALAYPLGEAVYRRMHPEASTVPATPEELEEWQTSPSGRHSMLRAIILPLLAFSPAFLSLWLWPERSTRIMIANLALVGCAFSFRIGYRWHEMEAGMRRFALVLVCIGPPAGFIGYVEHGGVSGAFVLAVKIAAVMVIPGAIGRLVAKYRG